MRGRKVCAKYPSPSSTVHSTFAVDTLLNPCSCGNLWKCNCASASTSQASSQSFTPQPLSLHALAHAASLQVIHERTPLQPSTALQHTKVARARAPSPLGPSRKRSKRDSRTTDTPGPSLPPIRMAKPGHDTISPQPYPVFEAMPPMSQIVSLAGSGCTCGVQCACPGCVEHRGPELASRDHRDCADGCGTCVDHSTRELNLDAPGGSTISTTFVTTTSSSSSIPASAGASPASFLDQFFARAAALPPPPPSYRKGGSVFDLTDTSNGYRSMDPKRTPVALPKLDCCGGVCLCPSDGCNCGSSCGGACLDHRFMTGTNINDSPTQSSQSAQAASPAEPKSCCAGKKKAPTWRTVTA